MRLAQCLGLLMALALHTADLRAQTDDQYKMEIGAGVALVSYEGDYNGGIFSNMQPGASVILRRIFNPYMGLRLAATYGKLKGNANDVKTWFPTLSTGSTGNGAGSGDGTTGGSETGSTGTEGSDGTVNGQTRAGAVPTIVGNERSNYEFNNSVFDLSLTYEYNFWPYGTGHDYRGAKRFTPFVFAGLGATVVSGGGKTVFTGNVPMGLGVKYKAAERLNVGLEWAVHFSLSDDLDGYKDPYGVKSSGLFKNTDCYSALQLSVTYSFMPKCRTCHNQDE